MAKRRKTRPVMTKAQARLWKKRWLYMNQLDFEAARRATVKEKFDALVQLMDFALSFPEPRWREAEDRLVRERWQALREVWSAG